MNVETYTSAPSLAPAQRPGFFSLTLGSLFTRSLTAAAVAGALLAAMPAAHAQEANPTSGTVADAPSTPGGVSEQNGIYIYKVKVVQRNLDCVNYLHRSGSTTIAFDGTPLLPNAKGEAKVDERARRHHDRREVFRADAGEWFWP